MSSSHKAVDKPIEQIKKDLNKEITFSQPEAKKAQVEVTKTSDLLGTGWHYFIEIEQKITQDFLFGWLPGKIQKYLKLFIPFTLMIIMLALPLPVDPQIKKALALFICIGLLWALETISIVVTALLIPVLAVILGLEQGANPFTSFSNPIIYLLLSGLVIAQAFRKHQLDRLIALRVLALSKGKMKHLLLYTMLTTAILGMWMSNVATIALLVPVIMSISAQISETLEKNYTGMLLLAAGFASAIGGLTTILGGNPNAITAAFLSNIGHFTFMDWVRIGLPISVALFTVAYTVIVVLYKVEDVKIKITPLTKEARRIKLTKEQRKTLLIFFPTIIFWLFGEQIVQAYGLPIAIVRTEIVGLIAAINFFAWRVLEWDDVRRIPWEIFLIVGGGLTLGQLLIDTGSAGFLANVLFSNIQGLPTLLFLFIIITITMVLANFVNNSSATIIMVPVLLNLAGQVGIDPWLLAMMAAMSTAIAPLTPIAMPSFSIIYGTGQVSRKEMVRTGLAVALACGPVLAFMMWVLTLV